MVIYEAKCKDCGYCQSFPEIGHAVIREDGQIRLLHDPGELRDLAEEGLTPAKAGLQGRFVTCYPRLCRTCGSLYDRRVITNPEVSVVPALVAAAIVTALLLLAGFAEVGLFVGLMTLFVMSAVLETCGDPLARRVAARKGYSVQDAPCRCDAPDFSNMVPPGMIFGRPFPCPQCGQQTLYCRAYGLS